jgi:Mg-chelatase subunit ChlD
MKKQNLIITSLILLTLISSCGRPSYRKATPKSETEKYKGSSKIEGASGMMDYESIPHKSSDKRIKKFDRDERSRPGKKPAHYKKSSSGLKAGYVDDNQQFNRYMIFLNKFKKINHYNFNTLEKITIYLKDKKNRSLAGADIKISHKNKILYQGKTYADGSILFFPSEYSPKYKSYKVTAIYNNNSKKMTIDRKGRRKVKIKFNILRRTIQELPLDILFIFDTTGSMGEEIARLKKTIELIHLNLTNLTPTPKVRFGMVLYKDKGDSYRTKIIHLTSNFEKFQEKLNKVTAQGGGDLPEDLQEALSDSQNKIKWNENGIKMIFTITDAPPHLNYGQKYTYKHAALNARKNAIKIISIGTGGLNTQGEYILRQIAQYTSGRYIFLTYGEKGESSGGRPGSVSHHTGANFSTDKLESIIIRFTKEELSYLTDKPLKEAEPYYEAVKVSYEKKEDTLRLIFKNSLSQLIDFSSISIMDKTPTTCISLMSSKNKQLKLNSEYFTEQLLFSLTKNKKFKMVERKNLNKIMEELSLQMTGLIDPDKISRVGKMIGAKLIIVGKVYKKKNKYEIFLKLLRVETSEILSVTKIIVDKSLGL